MAQQLNGDVERLEECSFRELQQIWRDEHLGDPPRVRARLMAALLAYHMQNNIDGSLPPALTRRLRDIAGDGSKTNLKVHAILQISPRVRRNQSAGQTPALLRGLIFGPTGSAMTPTHTRKTGKLYRYYVSLDVLKRSADPSTIGRVPAAEIERAVLDQIRVLLRQPEIVIRTWKVTKSAGRPFSEREVTRALRQLDPLWNELFPAEQARIVRLLVECVDVHADGGSRWATVCSLIETAKLNGVEPFAYLRDVLERLAKGHPNSQLDNLLPWSWKPVAAVNH